jgi:hypothetical protein
MRDRENLDKEISFDQKGASMYSLQLSRQSTKWPTVASLYIPDAVVPALRLGFVQVNQRFTISLDWLKGLGDGLGHVIWWAIFMGNRTVQESGRRNRNPLNNASHIRWRREEF